MDEFEKKIKLAYDDIKPSEDLILSTLKKVENQKQEKERKSRNNIIRLVFECGLAAAACFLLSFLFPNISSTKAGLETASVISSTESYLISILLFIILCAVFITTYIIRKKKQK